MKQKTLLIIIFSFYFFSGFAQKCDCEANYKWMKKTVEENDAGFKLALEQKGKEAYEKHNKSFEQKIKKATTKDDCAEILNNWLRFFRKGHLYASAIHNTEVTNKTTILNWPTVATSENEIRLKATIKDTDFEGIWNIGTYSIGIIRQDDSYKGIILSQNGTAWKENQVKFIINKDKSGVFYLGDFSPEKFKDAKLYGKNTLQLGRFFLYRTYPEFKEEEGSILYSKIISTPNSFFQPLSNQTLLLRIPTFDGSEKKVIDSLLTKNDQLIKSTKNLIIDIRNNGGGDDISYYNIIPLFYTNPIREPRTILYSTPLNNKRISDYLSVKDLSEKSRQNILKVLKVLNDSLGKFVNLYDDEIKIFKYDSIYKYPENIAIITNELNGSTAEQFVLTAKQSKKVKIFGRTTMGVLDIANMYSAISPTKDIRLSYGLSKSLRLPENPIDGIGIQPDFFLDKSIKDEQWINYVKNILEQ